MTYDWEDLGIEVLIGHTFTTIDGGEDSNELVFWKADGSSFKMYHEQDCCEDVHITDLCGELDWLVNTPILEAYEESNGEETEYGDSVTWTFYRIITQKGTVTIRWYGSSNGYYSESVSVVRSQEEKPKPAPKPIPAAVAQAVAAAPVFKVTFDLMPPTSTVRRIKDSEKFLLHVHPPFAIFEAIAVVSIAIIYTANGC